MPAFFALQVPVVVLVDIVCVCAVWKRDGALLRRDCDPDKHIFDLDALLAQPRQHFMEVLPRRSHHSHYACIRSLPCV